MAKADKQRTEGQAPDSQESGRTERSRARRVVRVLAWSVGGLLGLVLLLVLLLLIALQTNRGGQYIADTVLGILDPFDNAEVTVGDIGGNWVTNLRLHDVNLVRDDTVRMAHVDTLHLRYRVLQLLQGRFQIDEALVAGLDVAMTQQPDSTWDLLNVIAQDTTKVDTTASLFAFLAEDVTVRRARAEVSFYHPEKDSILYIEALDAQVADLAIGPGDVLNVAVPRLYAQFIPPDTDAPVTLRLAARLGEQQLVVDTLDLESERSDVAVEGTMLLPGEENTGLTPDLTIHADPLALADIAPFVPALNPEAVVTLEGQVSGTPELMEVVVTGTLGDGATFDIDGALSPHTEGPLTYRLTAQVRGLNPGYFTAGPSETPVLLSGNVQADLAGTDLNELSGTLDATLFDTRFGDYVPERTTLEARFTDGVAHLEAATGLRGAGLDLRGTLRPFADVPTYDVRGQVRDLDIGRFVEDGTQQSDITAAFRIEGAGFDPDSANLTAMLDLDPSHINRLQLRAGRAEVSLRDRRLRFDTDVTLPEGTVLAAGAATLGEEIRYEITQGELRNLDVAALVGDTTRSSINATFALRGRGTDPQTMRLEDVHLEVADAFYGTYEIQQALVNAALARGQLDVQMEARLNSGAFDLTGTLHPFAATPTYAITDGRFEDLNLGQLLQSPQLTSDLTGSVTLTGRGFEPEQMTLDARLDLADGTFNQQVINEGMIWLEMQRGNMTYEARLDTPSGVTYLAGNLGNVFGDQPTLALREGTFEGVNLGALLGLDGLRTNLTGTLSVDGSGFDPATGRWDVQLDLAASTINDLEVLGSNLTLELEDGFARLGGEVALSEGEVQLQASGRFFDEVPTYRAEGVIEQLSLDQLTGIDTLDTRLTLAFEVEGRGLEPETMELDATVQGQEAQVLGASVERLYAAVQLNGGLLRVDSLQLNSSLADIEGSGPIALFDSTQASDFQVDIMANNLSPLAPYLGAQVFAAPDAHLTARVYGRPGLLRFDAEADLPSVVYNDIRSSETFVRGAGELTRDLTLRTAEVIAEVGFTSTPRLSVEETLVEAHYNGQEITYLTDLRIDERHQMHATGYVDLQADSQRVVLNDDLTMQLGSDRWELLQEASISISDEYRVRNFLLYAEDQQIALDGVIDLDGEQSLVLTIENFNMGTVAELVDIEGLGGALNGTLDLTGPAEAPNISGTLNMDVLSHREPVGDLRLEVRYDSLRFNIDALLTHEEGGTLEMVGYVPIDLRLRAPSEEAAEVQALQISTPTAGDNAVDLRLLANSFDIGWLEPFLDPEVVNRVDGVLTADVTVGGTFEDPEVAGEAQLADGTMRLPQLNVTYERARADIEFSGDQVLVNHLEVHSRGSLIAEGTVDLPDLTLGEFNLAVSLEDFHLINTREYRIISSGDLELSGTTEQPVLTGDLLILSADIFLTEETTSEEFTPVELNEEDLRTLEQRFGVRVAEEDTTTFDFYVALEMDLDVDLERDVWLRSTANPDMNIQFTGDLELVKEANEDQQLFGIIEVIPQRSYINQFGRRFNITSGTLTFNGPAIVPYLDVQAEYQVRSRGNQGDEITIFLNLAGTPENLETELSSDPSTDLTNIVSYIATGRPADEAFQLGGAGTLADRGAGLALGQVANLIENAAGTELGLDVIEIRQEGLRGATVTAGKYVTRRLYVSVSQPISFSGDGGQEAIANTDAATRVITIEYELFEWLLARVASDGSALRALLLWEYAY